MAGLAGLLAGDAEITAGLVRTLEHLRARQGSEGQIASNVEHRDGYPARASFGSLVPRLDAPLWYVIGIALAARAGAIDPAPFRESVKRTVHLLDALEYNGRHLLYVPVGGDWADEYIYEGYVLHEQVLRAWALRLASETWSVPAWAEKASAIEGAVRISYWPPEAAQRGYPLASFTPARVFEMFDLATCSLLALSGVAPPLGDAALDFTGMRFLSQGTLPPAFDPVIGEGDPDWPALSRYHLHGFRNRPHEYHNGGVWMIWLGWLGLSLAQAGRVDDLAQLRSLVSARVSSQAYDFEEYFHGRTGAALGVRRMAYSATGIVFLQRALDPATLALFAR